MKLRKEFIVGIIATIGICGLVLGFFYLKGLELWKDRTSYYAVYDNSGGITNGRPITLNGLKVEVNMLYLMNGNDAKRLPCQSGGCSKSP